MKGPLARRPGPRRMQVAGAQKKKEVWPHNEERPTWTQSNKRYVFLVNWQQPVVFFNSASSLLNRYLPSTSKSSAQTVIKLSGIGLCQGLVGHSKLELYKCLKLLKSTIVIRLVLVFLRIVQVPESVAGFATLVAVQSLSELPSAVTSRHTVTSGAHNHTFHIQPES